MAKYLLTCACGRQLAVETGRAGETLVCDCGATVAVPTLRRLREMPVAREESGDGSATSAPSWGLRQGAITVSLLLAAVCLALAALSRMSEQPVPKIDPVARTESVEREVTNMTPLGAWQLWINSYRSLVNTGFEVFKHPATDSMQMTLDWHRAIQKTLLSIAAACVAAAVVLGLSGGKKRVASDAAK